MTKLGTYLLLMAWPGEDWQVIDRNLSIQSCAGQYAMARLADPRWAYDCQLVTFNAFRIFIRTKPEEMTQ